MMDAIVEKEGLTVSDEELEAELDKTCEEYKMTREDFEKQLGSKELFRYDMLMKKVMALVSE